MKKNDEIRKRVFWIFFWVLWIFLPLIDGVFHIQQFKCEDCHQTVLLSSFALFGYVVLGGTIYSLSKPTKSEIEKGHANGTSREEVVRQTLLVALMLFLSWLMALSNIPKADCEIEQDRQGAHCR